MGKYMKKSKTGGDVAVMEVAQLGVRTRAAKTLALQRLHSSSPLRLSPVVKTELDSSSYLELRSRRLEKLPPLAGESKMQTKRDEAEDEKKTEPDVRVRVGSRSGVTVSASASCEEGCFGNSESYKSFEPSLNLEGRESDRSTRESTPCNLIMNSDGITAPGSTTRRMSSATTYGLRNEMQQFIPTAQELEEFFALAEQQQRSIFLEKYNYDIVNDLPLPGRYQWVPLAP